MRLIQEKRLQIIQVLLNDSYLITPFVKYTNYKENNHENNKFIAKRHH